MRNSTSVVLAEPYLIIRLGVFILVLAGSALGADPPPVANKGSAVPLDFVFAGMEKGRKAVTDFRAYTVVAKAIDPRVLDPDAIPQKDDPLLINGKFVEVEKQLEVRQGDCAFVDQLTKRITPTSNKVRYTRYWFNGGTLYMQLWEPWMKQPAPVAYERQAPTMPLGLDHLQVEAPDSLRHQWPLRTQTLRKNRARVVGWETFGDLQCIRLDCDYEIAQGDGTISSNTESVLVCPERDFKEVFSERRGQYGNPADTVKEASHKTTVSRFQRYGETWLPAEVHTEMYWITSDGKSSLVWESLFRVVEMEIGASKANNIFVPLFTPDTTVYSLDGTTRSMGGDTRGMEDALQKGNLSVLKGQ